METRPGIYRNTRELLTAMVRVAFSIFVCYMVMCAVIALLWGIAKAVL